MPSLLLKPGNTPYPLPGLGSKGASLPYMANEIVAATLFMVPRWQLYISILSFAAVSLLPIPFVFGSNVPYRLFQTTGTKYYKMSTGGNSWHYSACPYAHMGVPNAYTQLGEFMALFRMSVRPYGGTQCVHSVCFIQFNRYNPTRTPML